MIAFSISNEDVKRILVWKPRNKDVDLLLHPRVWGFQKHAYFYIFILIISGQIIALLFTKSSPLRWYQILKVYLKKIYTKHYFKMRKILIGAKLLLMSIYAITRAELF